MEQVKNEIDMIQTHLNRKDLLLQLAEECSELSHAALKLHRKITGTNPTPTLYSDCENNLMEEAADVVLCLKTLKILDGGVFEKELDDIVDIKRQRWVSRLMKEEDK